MYFFIVNKISGNGRGLKVWTKIEKLMKEKRVDFLVEYTEKQGHAKEIIGKLKKEVSAVVVIGGDGTIHEVINGLVYKNIPLGVIPSGSGNDYARSMNIPFAPHKALERILTFEAKKIDIGKAGDRYFLSIAGMGFDGKVAEVTNASSSKSFLNKIRLGSLAYIVNIFKVLFTYQPSDVVVNIDGNERIYKDVWLIAMANLPYYGGGLKICPEADARDGKLDMCVVSGISRFELLFVFPLVIKGAHVKHRHVSMTRGQKVCLKQTGKMVLQCDGEIISHEKFKFKIEEKALNVL
ncbi:Putative lipid kinase YtlR [Bacillus sp. THAF10]|nr:Putative lipid kinase YtlR [Bacillus sp. THAF10]